ncbi:hypothetical protein [Amycolatopsis taiwanensis]|uniref:DUF3311 domain-containing protein n=1 Tax=Amycolatopsis taiwanensis TaxID=342230 RepID=A0A9W6VJ65_9PSEU|nr:hypothetical protein [Amycolatopsis taiwanensis]GLY68166.1 hypothetical protein Atai01_47850 [Amycolatopsis taiwanensis]
MVRSVVLAWLLLNAVVLVLYTVVPVIWFNDGHRAVAGMPVMLLWFTILPVAVPGVMALFYLWDRRLMARLRRRAPRNGGEDR